MGLDNIVCAKLKNCKMTKRRWNISRSIQEHAHYYPVCSLRNRSRNFLGTRHVEINSDLEINRLTDCVKILNLCPLICVGEESILGHLMLQLVVPLYFLNSRCISKEVQPIFFLMPEGVHMLSTSAFKCILSGTYFVLSSIIFIIV